VKVIPLDEQQRLYLSAAIDDWQPIEEHGISVVLDLDGDLDPGVSTVPNHLLYVYFPIQDEELPDLDKLHALARMAAGLMESGHRVLSHCCMGFNRSALVAGLILTHFGLSGEQATALVRSKRPGALFNQVFASYLQSLPPSS
jgi:protein-tyrosine phosphatase